jgi:2-polyprenyl-3-methyl-5-hydroxy-6-metoxy-1,4-benzoquinol methylase
MNDERTAEFFDRYARDFDAIYGNENTVANRVINRLFRQSMRKRYDLTLAGCDPVRGRSVLDVGCGPGHYSVELAKRGARRVLGVDFADGMLDLSRKAAEHAGVNDVCTFERRDFFNDDFTERFDYVIAMGFMDYVADAPGIVKKVVSLATSRAFFSFPLDGGVLAWQRKIRYRSRCELYMYTPARVRELFDGLGVRLDVKPISRDLFVTASVG